MDISLERSRQSLVEAMGKLRERLDSKDLKGQARKAAEASMRSLGKASITLQGQMDNLSKGTVLDVKDATAKADLQVKKAIKTATPYINQGIKAAKQTLENAKPVVEKGVERVKGGYNLAKPVVEKGLGVLKDAGQGTTAALRGVVKTAQDKKAANERVTRRASFNAEGNPNKAINPTETVKGINTADNPKAKAVFDAEEKKIAKDKKQAAKEAKKQAKTTKPPGKIAGLLDSAGKQVARVPGGKYVNAVGRAGLGTARFGGAAALQYGAYKAGEYLGDKIYDNYGEDIVDGVSAVTGLSDYNEQLGGLRDSLSGLKQQFGDGAITKEQYIAGISGLQQAQQDMSGAPGANLPTFGGGDQAPAEGQQPGSNAEAILAGNMNGADGTPLPSSAEASNPNFNMVSNGEGSGGYAVPTGPGASNPYGRTPELQQQIDSNVAGIDAVTEQNRQNYESKLAMQDGRRSVATGRTGMSPEQAQIMKLAKTMRSGNIGDKQKNNVTQQQINALQGIETNNTSKSIAASVAATAAQKQQMEMARYGFEAQQKSDAESIKRSDETSERQRTPEGRQQNAIATSANLEAGIQTPADVSNSRHSLNRVMQNSGNLIDWTSGLFGNGSADSLPAGPDSHKGLREDDSWRQWWGPNAFFGNNLTNGKGARIYEDQTTPEEYDVGRQLGFNSLRQ